MQKWKWHVWGLDLPADMEIEIEGNDREDSRERVIAYLKSNNIEWDTISQM